jgi:hypothetical protein
MKCAVTLCGETRGANIQALSGRRTKPPQTRHVSNLVKLTGEMAWSIAVHTMVGLSHAQSELECDARSGARSQ